MYVRTGPLRTNNPDPIPSTVRTLGVGQKKHYGDTLRCHSDL